MAATPNVFIFCVNIVARCAAGVYMGDAIERRTLALRERLFPADAIRTQDATLKKPVIVAVEALPAAP